MASLKYSLEYRVPLLVLFFNVLFCDMQDKRMSVMDALVHPYIDEGRLRYHSCMCKCCFTVPLTGLRHFCMDYEPVAPQTFDDKWEKKMSNVQQVKGTCVYALGCGCIINFSFMRRGV